MALKANDNRRPALTLGYDPAWGRLQTWWGETQSESAACEKTMTWRVGSRVRPSFYWKHHPLTPPEGASDPSADFLPGFTVKTHTHTHIYTFIYWYCDYGLFVPIFNF